VSPDLSSEKLLSRDNPGSSQESRPRRRGRPRSEARRSQIIVEAMRLFAENGYQGSRMEDLAKRLGISKASIFQYFDSKEALFLEAYKKAVALLPSWLDAPSTVREQGFFATLRYWLENTEHMIHEDWIPARISILAMYGTDLRLKREINRYMMTEDPYGTVAFVRFGIERREVRDDVALEMVASILEWTSERFQDALLAEELDPGLFRHHDGTSEKAQARIEQFMTVLRGAIGFQKD
jgi:AcrR family transcriptional regulator